MCLLILDLDDTIFETKSMSSEIFEAPISVLIKHCINNNVQIVQETLIADLWSLPIDVVFSKHNIPNRITTSFYEEIAKIDDKQLSIKPFQDYSEVNSLTYKKVLVTTGLRELQMAKINALNIASNFEDIYIDDPRELPRKDKQLIFQSIIKQYQIEPKNIWVIGDNPTSEIRIGKALGMNTIQRKSESKSSTLDADYVIESFTELRKIIR